MTFYRTVNHAFGDMIIIFKQIELDTALKNWFFAVFI